MFAESLKSLRENEGLSQKSLANQIKVSQPTIAAYESGKREPDFATLIKLADFFQISIDYLMGRTEYKNYTERASEDEIMSRISKLLEKIPGEKRKEFLMSVFGFLDKQENYPYSSAARAVFDECIVVLDALTEINILYNDAHTAGLVSMADPIVRDYMFQGVEDEPEMTQSLKDIFTSMISGVSYMDGFELYLGREIEKLTKSIIDLKEILIKNLPIEVNESHNVTNDDSEDEE